MTSQFMDDKSTKLTQSESEPPSLPPANHYDVLVVGAGAAGLYAALCLPADLQVGLVTKDTLSLSASDWAQGGIAAVMAAEDSTELHFADTLRAGAGLCDRPAVKTLVEQAPACIQSLVELGVGFDRHQGQLALTLEAAHSHRRVLHAADTTGRAVVSALAEQVLRRSNITVLPQAFALELWLDQQQHCQGISLAVQNQVRWLRASAVVLATGGGGQVFSQTTNPAISTGDGVAMAWRAGAIIRDPEFVQFHPTALSQPGAPRFLISEAVRGEGAHLVDDRGIRFAFDYHPAGELASRDVVSRAIYRHLQKTGLPHVWLDLRPIAAEKIQQRFPNIVQVCRQWGVDLFQSPVPVTPAAHYWMGGIWVSPQQNQYIATSIPGLYTVGETASTGVHGANRLASNSLLECIVFGAQFGQRFFPVCPPGPEPTFTPIVGLDRADLSLAEQILWLEQLRQNLPDWVWHGAGICRDAETMTQTIAILEAAHKDFGQLPLSQQLINLTPGQGLALTWPDAHAHLRLWGEVRNLLQIALLILKGALFRQESRGGHYRSDFPDPRIEWQVHTMTRQSDWWVMPPPEL